MEGRERSQSKTEPSTASTVSPSQSRESRFSRSFGGVFGLDARPAETAVNAEGDRRPSNVASDSRVSVDGSDGNATDDHRLTAAFHAAQACATRPHTAAR